MLVLCRVAQNERPKQKIDMFFMLWGYAPWYRYYFNRLLISLLLSCCGVVGYQERHLASPYPECILVGQVDCRHLIFCYYFIFLVTYFDVKCRCTAWNWVCQQKAVAATSGPSLNSSDEDLTNIRPHFSVVTSGWYVLMFPVHSIIVKFKCLASSFYIINLTVVLYPLSFFFYPHFS